jgi:uncharacterized protein YjiS (DUF1127 family)
MTTAVLRHDLPRAQSFLPAMQPVWSAWLAWRQRKTDANALARAGRLGPRLLEDMGIEDATARALVGDWDQLRPNGWLVRPLK